MPIRDANVDKAAAEAGTTKLPDDATNQEPVYPPGDERNRQELERAAEEDGGLGADGKAVDKHQAEIERLQARINELESEMLSKQSAAEALADNRDKETDPWPADSLDEKYVAKAAKAVGLLPSQVFNIRDMGDVTRVYTEDSRKLDVKSKDVK